MDKVVVGIASVASRENSLRRTIASLRKQSLPIDRLYIYLNDYKEIPFFLRYKENKGIICFLGAEHAGDLGDAGKFFKVGEERAKYFSVDDDLEFPHNYLEYMLNGLHKHNYKKIVSLHGSILKFPLTNFYRDRRMISFKRELKNEVPVHIPGTGVTAFHTDTIRLNKHDFPVKNMADIWLGVQAQKQNVGIVVLPHKKKWVQPLPNTNENSIFQRHVRDDMKIKQMAQIINSIEQWTIY